ncbi:uncharacterized protein LOC135378605 isoform X2 [Ornithodoros turicata]|uniref:uncharacterized protein LOC135378605 isoform X2 n=1 Tax=Ornithodoros turicata TaxID=34597 RepID=UPI00313893B3
MTNAPAKHCWSSICKNTQDRNPGLMFFQFPSDRALLKQWCINSGREDLVDHDRRYFQKSEAVLCEEHFLDSQFVPAEARQFNRHAKQLLWNAIPTQFRIPFPDGLLKNVLHRPTSKRRRRPCNAFHSTHFHLAVKRRLILVVQITAPSPACFQQCVSTDEDEMAQAVSVENYEMSAIHTFPRERLVSIAKKQWQEIKRLRVQVKALERTLADGITADGSYLLDVLSRNLEGPLLDRVVDIIVGDTDDRDDDYDDDANVQED